MTIQLKKVKRDGDTAYICHDENGKEWRVYKSFHLWRYRREDHDISSIGYLTLADATAALTKALETSP